MSGPQGAGAAYVLGVSSKPYTFAQPTVIVTVTDALNDVDFVAAP